MGRKPLPSKDGSLLNNEYWMWCDMLFLGVIYFNIRNVMEFCRKRCPALAWGGKEPEWNCCTQKAGQLIANWARFYKGKNLMILSMDFIINVIDVSDGVKVHVYSVQVMILFFETVGKVGRCRGRLRSSFAVDRTTWQEGRCIVCPERRRYIDASLTSQ